jgi:hypothetical protein
MSITAGNDCDSINVVRDGIFKLLMSPGFDSKESIPPAYVAWRAGTTFLFLLDSQPSIYCSKNSSTGHFPGAGEGRGEKGFLEILKEDIP